jgi:hypothetical protein
MPQVLGFKGSILGIEEINVADPVVHVRIHGQVSYSKGGQIMKKVSALTGIDTEMFKSGFNNDSGS